MQPSQLILHTFYGRVRDTTRLMNEAQSVAAMGYPVVAIGAAREGLSSEPSTETINGVQAVLVPLIAKLRPKHIFQQIMNWIRGHRPEMSEQLVGRSKIRTLLNIILYNLWLVRVGGRYTPRLIHCHEIYAFPGSWLLAKRYRIPLVYDAWEPTYFVEASGLSHRILKYYQTWIVKRADTIVITAQWLESLVKRVTKKPIVLIGNWKKHDDYVVEADVLEAYRQKHTLDHNTLIVSYIGLLFEHREVRPLIEAIKNTSGVQLLIAGRGPLETWVKEQAAATENIIWLGWLEQYTVPIYTQLSDVIYCCVPNTAEFQHFLPNKLFDAIVAGKALLAHRDVGEMAAIVEQYQAGYLVPEVTSGALQEAFVALQNKDLLTQLQQNAYALRDQYHWDIAEERLAALYEELITD